MLRLCEVFELAGFRILPRLPKVSTARKQLALLQRPVCDGEGIRNRSRMSSGGSVAQQL
jgi:hypothetical protein